MSAVCEICGREPTFGKSISHSHIRSNRRFSPNVQRVRATVDGVPRRVRVCTRCIKAGKIAKR